VVFEVEGQEDALRLTGALADDRWLGAVTMGERRADVELTRIVPMEPEERRAVVGTYRTESGRVVGIAPFSEFGERLFLTDYETGRIAPLLPLTPDRSLVGQAIISPVFPADSLTVRWSGDRVEEIRFAERGRPVAVAARIATRDEEVQFTSGTVRLAGTLVHPPGPPPYPAIVLVHGSNAQTRDALGPWARFFVSAGFAVLSYDKRGTGNSSGDWKEADFAALADDVVAGLRFLATRSDIDRGRIGLWGISQAGWILPMVAAQASSEVAFVVVHAGSGATVREEGLHYLEAELRAAGLPPASVAVGMRYQQLDDAVTATGRGWNALQRYYEEQRVAEPWLWPPRAPDDWFRRYFRMLMDFDPTPYWRQVQCPVLLFYGEVDANVPPAVSWPPIERALRNGGNSRVTMFVLPKANHVFLEARTGGRDEYPGLSRFTPGYFSQMARWLEATVR
jgi:pimeloyl-ACP methyl ester carboxylesterase